MIETKQNLARIRLRVWNVLAGPEGVLASREIEFKQAFWRERAFSAGVYTSARQTEEVRVRFDNLFITERGDGAATSTTETRRHGERLGVLVSP